MRPPPTASTVLALEETQPPQPPKCKVYRETCSAWTSRSKIYHLNSNRMAPAAIKVGVYGGTLQTNQSWAEIDIDLEFGTCFFGRVWGNLGTICQPITENTAICAHWHCVLIERLYKRRTTVHVTPGRQHWEECILHFLNMRAIRTSFVVWPCSHQGVAIFVRLDLLIQAGSLMQSG